MYSGTTFHNKSGNVIGAHQKIDRVAHKALRQLLPGPYFPTTRNILNFEGKNGPDGLKSKSPGDAEPWYFWDPTNEKDTQLLDLIDQHFSNLVEELRDQNEEKSAFEAAWLSHAVVDGLTPAHHYPYEAKLEELRGEGQDTRDSIKKKAIIKGDSRKDTLKKNWEMWGHKGLMSTHGHFEIGVATIIAPLKLKEGYATDLELELASRVGLREIVKLQARYIYNLDIYNRFYETGWTSKLGNEVKDELVPAIVKAVTLAWALAASQASFF
jgi:hypothetical protein